MDHQVEAFFQNFLVEFGIVLPTSKISFTLSPWRVNCKFQGICIENKSTPLVRFSRALKFWGTPHGQGSYLPLSRPRSLSRGTPDGLSRLDLCIGFTLIESQVLVFSNFAPEVKHALLGYCALTIE
jgi:hypothetical protein